MAQRLSTDEDILFKHRNITNNVVLALQNMIIKRELKANQRIYVDELSKKFNISQTPIREALYKLEGMNLINIKPRKGSYVASFTKQDVLDTLEIRMVLERLAVERISNIPGNLIENMKDNLRLFGEAADKEDFAFNNEIDRAFHLLLVEASGSRQLSRTYKNLSSHIGIQVLLYEDKEKALEELQAVQEEHVRIVEAFATKNKREIKKAIRNHLDSVRKRITKTKEAQIKKVIE